MTFPFEQAVERLRARPVTDPYSDDVVAADWADPDVLPLPGAFIAQSSTARALTAGRTQILESKSLFCAPTADVRVGDKIRAGGIVYEIDGFPAADVNPFTGWQPVCEVPLTRAAG